MTTPLSLLQRLRQAPCAADWERLHDVYRPLIRGWLVRVPGLREGEADDLSQEVLMVVVREIGKFERQREGSFRAWLRRVTVHRVRGHLRQRARQPRTGLGDGEAESFLSRLEDPASEQSAQWDRAHDRHVLDRLLAIVRGDFQPDTWQAFQRFAVESVPAARVARELGMTENAVLLAKSRVLRRLREQAEGLID